MFYVDNSGTGQFPPPLNASGTNWIFFGSGLSDQAPSSVYQPFGMQLTLTSLSQFSDIITMFAEYQFLSCQMEIQLMQGVATSNDISFISPYIPEIIAAVDPNGTVPATVPPLEAYGNVRRQMLSPERVFKASCVPKPALQIFNPGAPPTPAFGYDNQPNVWLNSASNTIPHYGHIGIVRNLASQNSIVVRIGGSVKLAVRRPR